MDKPGFQTNRNAAYRKKMDGTVELRRPLSRTLHTTEAETE
jgi:hypothetical protein